MKISDLVKSLEKIKAKHGDLPIAFEISTKIYDDDGTVSNSGFFNVEKLGENVEYLNINNMLG